MTTWGLTKVRVRFRARVALDDVDVSVDPRTVTALVGGDGAGKSTALRALVGVVVPERGEVSRPARELIGFLAGQNAVYNDLTVDENLDFVAHAYGLRGTGYERRRADLLDRTALATARQRLGGQLSGGMRQKLGVAQALLPKPELVVLDEPTTGVDPVSRLELTRLISHAASEGAAVVFSTTYMSDAERADLVVVLDDGHVLLTGSPDDIVRGVPGTVWASDAPPSGVTAWRRQDAWHFYTGGSAPSVSATAVPPDLEDAVLVAAVQHQRFRDVGVSI